MAGVKQFVQKVYEYCSTFKLLVSAVQDIWTDEYDKLRGPT